LAAALFVVDDLRQRENLPSDRFYLY
jgi:hypothetical protein